MEHASAPSRQASPGSHLHGVDFPVENICVFISSASLPSQVHDRTMVATVSSIPIDMETRKKGVRKGASIASGLFFELRFFFVFLFV